MAREYRATYEHTIQGARPCSDCGAIIRENCYFIHRLPKESFFSPVVSPLCQTCFDAMLDQFNMVRAAATAIDFESPGD